MAGASDKARFYLEQSIPELQEYERKNIFNKVRLLRTFDIQLIPNNARRKRSPRLRRKGPTSNTRSMLEARIRLTTPAMQSLR